MNKHVLSSSCAADRSASHQQVACSAFKTSGKRRASERETSQDLMNGKLLSQDREKRLRKCLENPSSIEEEDFN